MLQTMRHWAHTWVVKGLMLFLIVSFSVWGIGDIFRGNPLHSTVAKAGHTDISVETLNHAFEQSLARARQKLGTDISTVQAKQLGLLDQTLQVEIKRTLVDQDIKRLNIDVPQDSIIKMIADQPQFRSKDGSFNKDLFGQFLTQQGLNETSFISKAQDDVAREVLLNALASSQNVPQIEVDTLYKARAQKHILDVVTIDGSKIGGIATPDDKALRDYYDKNPQFFTAPEYRSLTIAALSTDAIEKNITITDDQVKREYDDKSDQLTHGEQRDIVQTVVQDENAAKQLATQARASGDLVAAAKANKQSSVPLNKIEEKNLLPELSKPVFALKVGEVSDPIKTQLGWHVIQVKNIIAAGKPDYDSVKESLRDDMRRDQAIDEATRVINKLDDQLAAGHSLDDIADELKLRLVKIPAVDATGLTADGAAPKEFPNKDAVLKDGFAQNNGDTSPIEDDKSGNYYVVRTDKITPSAAKPFDQVKDKVVKAWTAHEQMAKAQAEAIKIEKDLRDGKPLDSFASQEGVTIRASSPLSELGDTDALLPATLVAQALKLKKGDTTSAAFEGKEIVVRVASIADADVSKPDPRKNRLAGQIKQQSGDEILDQYTDHLRDVFPVKVDNELLDRLRQQD